MRTRAGEYTRYKDRKYKNYTKLLIFFIVLIIVYTLDRASGLNFLYNILVTLFKIVEFLIMAGVKMVAEICHGVFGIKLYRL